MKPGKKLKNYDDAIVTVRLRLSTVLLIGAALDSIDEPELAARFIQLHHDRIKALRERDEQRASLSERDLRALDILERLFGGNLK